MLSRLHRRFRIWRRRLARSHWTALLLGLPVERRVPAEPKRGVIMIQIDGLSLTEFERAAARGRLRHLRRLLRRDSHAKHAFYSGMPSTTPAVQGELFYRVRGAVPAFEFVRKSSGTTFRMFDPEAAETIETELRATGSPPLLEGARSYSNIYRAGAAKSYYCSADLRVRIFHRLFRPRVLLVGLIHCVKLVRMAGLALLEVALAAWDCARGMVAGENPGRELMTIPARVFVGILLREFIRLRVLLDIEEGIPLIHANFLGYDEQSHRRGPASPLAHWTLSGIDRAIRDIHRAARRVDSCDYELVVYSDHGQEHTIPYGKKHGRPLEEALRQVFARGPLSECRVLPASTAERTAGETPSRKRSPSRTMNGDVLVAAMGPIGHVYLPQRLNADDMESYAKAMLGEAGIPLVLWLEDGSVRAANANGMRHLPEDAAEIVGPDHPFRDDVARDTAAMVRHPDAGDFVLSGWNPHGMPLSFPPENGAHAGPGREETRGFLLLPEALDRHGISEPFRAETLYDLVSTYLGETRQHTRPRPSTPRSATTLRVMTYNIHSCVGIDGRLRPDRITRMINRHQPDVVCLQEVDAHRARSGGRDQAHWIASHLDLHHVFHSMLADEDEKYGIAIFSAHRFETVRKDFLTPAGHRPWVEARGAIWIRLETAAGPVNVINTHFGLGTDERNRQAAELLSERWLGNLPPDEPAILCGDFNSGRRSVAWKRLHERMPDVRSGRRREPGFPSTRPLLALDHIFANHRVRAHDIVVPRDHLAATASDHLPIVADLEILPPRG